MKQLTIEDLDHLAQGAAILGSGGGGNPTYNRLITEHMMEQYGPVYIEEASSLSQKDLVAPVAFMGAPLVGMEKIASGKEFPAILNKMKTHLGRTPNYLMPAEIGGANAFTPLWIGAMCQIPVLDADLIGRAFPELQMSSCTVYNIPAAPAFMADCLGNSAVMEASCAHKMERMARQIAIAMGSRACISLHLMNGVQALKHTILGSITQGIKLGKVLSKGVEALIKETQGEIICSGVLTDIDQKIEGGFLKGVATINGAYQVHYQNEYLVVYKEQKRIAVTPDIIMLLESETAAPITSDLLRYGLRVDLIRFSAHPLWYTPRGLELVGPSYFGYGEKKCV